MQDAVYRAAPKRLRAELHERYADRLDTESLDLPDLDEFVGYHLEQAFVLRTELAETDRRVGQLGEDAGRRLGDAGVRALVRGDGSASDNLLSRAIALLGPSDPKGRELRCNHAIVVASLYDAASATEILERLIDDSERAGDERIEAWARLELEYLLVRRGHLKSVDDLLEAVRTGIPLFERTGDQRQLGRAWLFAGWAYGGHRSDHGAWADAAERALTHYRAASWPTSTCLGELAGALYWGSTPVKEAMARLEHHLPDADPIGAAYLETFLGGLRAQLGEIDDARAQVLAAHQTLMGYGHRTAAFGYCYTVLGEIELLARDGPAATATLTTLCEGLRERGDFSHLASRASDLAKALVLTGAFDEAEASTHVAEQNAADDDVNAQMLWRPVRARILAEQGAVSEARRLARDGVRRADTTDDLNRRAEAHRLFGEVLQLAGRPAEALDEYGRSADLYRLKGNLVGEAFARSLEEELVLTVG